jgi:hypothetical protein
MGAGFHSKTAKVAAAENAISKSAIKMQNQTLKANQTLT